MDFSRHLAGLDAAIDAHLRDDGWIRPKAGGPDVSARIAIEHPSETDRLIGAGIERSRPWVEISISSVPVLVKGDCVLVGAVAPFTGWRIAEAPKRPGDGRHWRAEVEPLGLVDA
ncbi:head-tail joining protein [Brevundimonas subvibrioides]|uniref:Uncharacterized protein n=1 Tax=Brevundimonas subvibrioides (strain ATCC 15264 / DSM 4735 / LMG 14903 / NBRC 16000 / CB 81) TaxID=633149 RepID=D9QFY1_BRESC|nr:hypothetical protein [Brevundimonas subvibrioides]ADL00695.1 hypothetical protein Bresu_1383 [Brevundimonas subvibrioides ATCC 15264]